MGSLKHRNVLQEMRYIIIASVPFMVRRQYFLKLSFIYSFVICLVIRIMPSTPYFFASSNQVKSISAAPHSVMPIFIINLLLISFIFHI